MGGGGTNRLIITLVSYHFAVFLGSSLSLKKSGGKFALALALGKWEGVNSKINSI